MEQKKELSDSISYSWDRIGRLDIDFVSPRSVEIRFSPKLVEIGEVKKAHQDDPQSKIRSKAHSTLLVTSILSYARPNDLIKAFECGFELPCESVRKLAIMMENRFYRNKSIGAIEMPRLDGEFADLSADYRILLQGGDITGAAATLYKMSEILREENYPRDQLKVLMLVFYMKLSGVAQRPHIDAVIPERAIDAIEKSGLSSYQVEELYLETIHGDETPWHCMNVRDSLYIFSLCLSGMHSEAEELLKKM